MAGLGVDYFSNISCNLRRGLRMSGKIVQVVGNAAFVIGMASGALIEAISMMSTNYERYRNGESLKYVEDDYKALLEERGLHYRALMDRIWGK